MMEKTIFCNNKCIHYRRSCQMLSNFFGNHHPRNGRGKGKVKTSVTFCEMQRLMLQTFSAPTFLLPLMFAILRERLYLDCNAVPRDWEKSNIFFLLCHLLLKIPLKTTDSRFVENLSITLIDGYFRVEKVKKNPTYLPSIHYVSYQNTFMSLHLSTVMDTKMEHFCIFLLPKVLLKLNLSSLLRENRNRRKAVNSLSRHNL